MRQPPNMYNDKYSEVALAGPMEQDGNNYDDMGRFPKPSSRVSFFEQQEASWLRERVRTWGIVLTELRYDDDIMSLLREPGQEWRLIRDLKFTLGQKVPTDSEVQTTLCNIGRRASVLLGIQYVEQSKPDEVEQELQAILTASQETVGQVSDVTEAIIPPLTQEDLATRALGRIEYWKDQISQDMQLTGALQ